MTRAQLGEWILSHVHLVSTETQLKIMDKINSNILKNLENQRTVQLEVSSTNWDNPDSWKTKLQP